MEPSKKLLRLKKGLEGRLAGTSYHVRIGEKETVDRTTEPVLEVWHDNNNPVTRLFHSQTVAARFAPIYWHGYGAKPGGTETDIMTVAYRPSEKEIVARASDLQKMVLSCGYQIELSRL
ncbi:hypothetical protein HYV82_02525 [Candidatus Woesearchaeota archaeon]|nr:hypothetical protein [Candidatus Woesearchaeota archaeon]